MKCAPDLMLMRGPRIAFGCSPQDATVEQTELHYITPFDGFIRVPLDIGIVRRIDRCVKYIHASKLSMFSMGYMAGLLVGLLLVFWLG